MTEVLRAVLNRYGRALTLTHGGTAAAVRGFLQPLSQRSKAAPYAVTALGTADDRRWLLLTGAEVADGDLVACGGDRYTVRTCAAQYIGSELSHWEAVLERAREAEA